MFEVGKLAEETMDSFVTELGKVSLSIVNKLKAVPYLRLLLLIVSIYIYISNCWVNAVSLPLPPGDGTGGGRGQALLRAHHSSAQHHRVPA